MLAKSNEENFGALVKQQEQIAEQIYIIGEKAAAGQKMAAIPDGVLDCRAYLNSSPKIAWILKEPHDGNDGLGFRGGWTKQCDIVKHLKDNKWSPTDKRIILTMYAIRHQLKYEDVPCIKECPEMGNVLKDVLWINLSKMPGKSLSDASYINSYKKYWRDIVLKQIDVFNPDVLIFGNNLSDTIFNDFVDGDRSINLEVIVNDEWNMHYLTIHNGKDNRLVLHAYHPSYLGLSNKEKEAYYVNTIVNAIHNHLSKERLVKY